MLKNAQPSYAGANAQLPKWRAGALGNRSLGVGSCIAVLLLTITGVRAATSDVADAVMRGDSVAVRRLLTQKADVSAPQADGATALHWAVYQGD